MFTFKIVVTDECQKKWGSLYDSFSYQDQSSSSIVNAFVAR